MSEFATAWDSFFVIVGAAAGALIGLQFVVITLIAEKPPKDAANASAAFATPTIVHFSASLLISALMRVPWPSLIYAAASWGVMSLAGLIYIGAVAWWMRRQAAYQPGFEDWIFHLVLPAISYALLGVGVLVAAGHMMGALFAVAGSALLLLFIGIHNAWDAVSYHVFVSRSGSQREALRNGNLEKERK
jgi:hypothetical protein